MNHTRKWGPWIAAGLLILQWFFISQREEL
jgi:hypothetical protein